MKELLVELVTLVSSGSLGEDDILRIADEAAKAYADPQAYLTANPQSDYEDDGRIPLGQWVLLNSLPDNVLFQARQPDELFQQILDSFGPPDAVPLKPAALVGVDQLSAMQRIQVQLSELYPQTDGYELVDFGEPLEEGLQMVLIYTRDLPRLLALAMELGIYAAPAYESRLTELGDGEDG